MVKTVFALLSLGLLLSGCATEEYVLQQQIHLADKLGMLEARIYQLDGTVKQLPRKQSLSAEEKKNLDRAYSRSQIALDEVKNLLFDLKQMDIGITRAETAALRAEAAAEKAGQSEKSAKRILAFDKK